MSDILTTQTRKSTFEILSKIDVSDKIKKKKDLSYLSWASAWAELKKVFPDASFKIYPQLINVGNEVVDSRFWHDDGRSGWVEVGVTVDGVEIREVLAIMDFKNASIPADKITSADANKAVKRCLVKCIALHGLAGYIYEGEDLPEETVKQNDIRDKVAMQAKKRAALSEKAKNEVAELCKAAEREAYPDRPDDEITGNYMDINNAEILEALHRKLLKIRK